MTLGDSAGEWVFAVEDQDAAGLWSELLPVKARVPDRFRFGAASALPVPVTPPTVTTILTPKERLQSLDSLRSEGLVTDEEWTQRRAEIISSI